MCDLLRCLSTFWMVHMMQYLARPSASFWRRQWQPTPVLLPGKSHGQRSLVGYSPWVERSWTRLSDFTFTFHFHALEKKWQPTPLFLSGESRTEEPGGLPTMGSHRVGHD